MDCRTCQPTLLDLAYGELAPELASVVRAHVDGCESCGAALRALRAGMEGAEQLSWLEPPPRLRENAMAYAAAHARERAEAAVAKSTSKERVALGQRLVDFIARLASGRQFAMVTVSVLVVAVGVWVIPELQPLPEGQGVTVVSPDPAGEAAPSAGLAPAEPLDLKVDARSRRIRSREEIEAAQLAKAASADLEAEGYAVEEKLEAPPADSDELARLAEPTAEAFEAEASSSNVRESAKRAKQEPQAFPESDLGELAAAQASSGARAGAGVSLKAARPASKGRAVDDLRDSNLGAPAPAPAAPKPTTQAIESKSKSSSEPRADAVSSLERARALRAAQGCGAAQPVYEQAVTDYSRATPQSAVLGAALIELAECQWQLGRTTSARATLKRAEQIAPVAVRARAMLESDAPARAPAAAAAEAPAEPASAAPSKD